MAEWPPTDAWTAWRSVTKQVRGRVHLHLKTADGGQASAAMLPVQAREAAALLLDAAAQAENWEAAQPKEGGECRSCGRTSLGQGVNVWNGLCVACGGRRPQPKEGP